MYFGWLVLLSSGIICSCALRMRTLWHRFTRRLTEQQQPASSQPSSSSSSCSSSIACTTADSASDPTAVAAVPIPTSASSVCPIDEGSALDSIESSEARLKHPTADRARPPARRPPSHIGSPPGHKETSSTIVEENGESLAGPTNAVVHLGHNGHNNGHHPTTPAATSTTTAAASGHEVEVGKRSSIKDLVVTINGGPIPHVINLAGRPLANGLVATTSSSSSGTGSGIASSGMSNRVANLNKDDVDSKTSENPTARKGSATLLNEATQKLEAEVLELRTEVEHLRENTVSREEFTSLLAQIKQLQETMETNRAHYSKMVRELMTEVDEEKKQRMNLQVEIDRLKKITVTV